MRKTRGKDLRMIDAPHYGYWQAFYQSFYSAKLYVDVGKRWSGLSILYLLFMSMIVTLPLSARLVINFNHFFHQAISTPLGRLPALYIQNGLVSLDKPMPYFVKSNSGDVIAVVDTTGKITSFSKKYPQLSVLVTRDKLFYRIPNSPSLFKIQTQMDTPISVQSFDKSMNQVFDGKEWVKSSGLETIRIVTELMIYPTVVMLLFSVSLVFLLAFALMAQLVAKLLLKHSLTYLQAFRLLTVSSTPQTIVLMMALAFDSIIMGTGMVLSILLAGYFSYAVLSLRRESKHMVLG